MGRFRRLAVGVTVLAMVSAGAMAPASAHTKDRKLFTVMTGAQEAPGPGDTDGIGVIALKVNPAKGRVCYVMAVHNIAPATAAHVHRAAVGSPGPVVVPLDAPTSGFAANCATVAPALAQELVSTPEAFYVNVHNAPFPGGAIRGQLAALFH